MSLFLPFPLCSHFHRRPNGSFLISGDVHFTELNRAWLTYQGKNNATFAQPIYDFTSSGLTHSWDGPLITPIVKSALMHTMLVRDDGLTAGEERECGNGGATAVARAGGNPLASFLSASLTPPGTTPQYVCHEVMRTVVSKHCSPPGSNAPLMAPIHAVPSNAHGSLFSAEQNFGEIEIEWVTIEKDNGTAITSVLDYEQTMVTFRAVSVFYNTSLWEFSFPLSHIVPSRVYAPAVPVTEAPATPAVAAAASRLARKDASGSLTATETAVNTLSSLPAGPTRGGWIWRLVRVAPRLLNGLLPPSFAPSMGERRGKPPRAEDCAKAVLTNGFSDECAMFMFHAYPPMAFNDSVYYISVHGFILVIAMTLCSSLALAPILFWNYRKVLPGGALPWITLIIAFTWWLVLALAKLG
jgi:hypothetical protein